MFYLPTGLVPFYPVYRLLGPCVRRDFLFTPPVVPPPRIPLVRFPPTPPVTPTSLFSWTPPKAHAHRCLLSCASYSCNLAMNPSAAPRIPRLLQGSLGTTSPLCVLVWTTARSRFQTPGKRVPLTFRWLRILTVLDYAYIPNHKLPVRSRVLPASHRSKNYSTGY